MTIGQNSVELFDEWTQRNPLNAMTADNMSKPKNTASARWLTAAFRASRLLVSAPIKYPLHSLRLSECNPAHGRKRDPQQHGEHQQIISGNANYRQSTMKH